MRRKSWQRKRRVLRKNVADEQLKEKIQQWVNSQEFRQEIEKIAEDSRETCENLDRQRRVSEKELKDIFFDI